MSSSHFDLEPADLSRRSVASLTDSCDVRHLSLGLRHAKPELASLWNEEFPIFVEILAILLERLEFVFLCLELGPERLELFVDGKFGFDKLAVFNLKRTQFVLRTLKRVLSVNMLTK
jgi:hypothetical protein